MPNDVFSMYRQYLALGGKRSLTMLADMASSPSLSTLKRWSIHYGWTALVATHDEIIAQRMMTEFTNRTRLSTEDLIHAGITNFYKLTEPNSADPALSKKERRRILNPSVLDFCRLIRLERELRRDLKRH